MADPTPVAVHGFTWTAGLMTVTNLLIGGALVAWIKQRAKMRELNIGSDERLRGDLLARVTKLERTLDRAHARHEAERALDRHKINNLTQCFDAVMLMLEAAPERGQEIVTRVKAMRESQIAAEAIEKAAIHAAEISHAAEDAE